MLGGASDQAGGAASPPTAPSGPLLAKVSRGNATDYDADPNRDVHSDGGSSSSLPSAREDRSSVWPPARAAVKSEQPTTLPECPLPAPLLPDNQDQSSHRRCVLAFSGHYHPLRLITLALGRARSGRIVGFSVRKNILRICKAFRRFAGHRPMCRHVHRDGIGSQRDA